MPLTPLDIHNKEFTRKFRGYDEDEVNEFLDQVIKDFEVLLRENRQQQEVIQNMQSRVDYFSSMEETLNKSIIVAQEAGEEVKANATKEASLILKQAEREAEQLQDSAQRRAQRTDFEVEQMRKKIELYRNRFKVLIDAQMELLTSHDWDAFDSSTRGALDEIPAVAYNDDDVV
ncbi:DivIVA domain-containing protein [Exiguobacterium sp. s193]|uniref:DivIVA domain-containing protein n=1 Tax=Exiguobacterium sp. s193 TaxID=2751207 RepID=UPI001BEC76FB|nr:DivIVA domain-containing protein [Exiguobacterium sp. s193]